MNALRLEAAVVQAGLRRLLGPLDITVPPGEVVSILGPSGAGKSSLLAWLCGALPPGLSAMGRVFLGERELTTLPPERRGLGILFQDDLLFPHLDVAGNLAFGLAAAVRGRAARRAAIAAALDSVGLPGIEARDPATLSGGERARVALLRVLLSAPGALLLDEPFGRLDPATRVAVRTLTFRLARERGLPTLLVTHDADDVAAAAGPVLRIGAGGS
ncbi:MAG: ATP-binding cassette domain-containing protein [Chromatiales bacterium]|jgi:putative thiamine transport system ATP-binding protein|nr:ATP-binding cassette domain-containing protein [Chromatiales bacterium]